MILGWVPESGVVPCGEEGRGRCRDFDKRDHAEPICGIHAWVEVVVVETGSRGRVMRGE